MTAVNCKQNFYKDGFNVGFVFFFFFDLNM